MLRTKSSNAWLAAGSAGLSVVIPHSGTQTLDATISKLTTKLGTAHIAHEIVVVNDNSTGGSGGCSCCRRATLQVIQNAFVLASGVGGIGRLFAHRQ